MNIAVKILQLVGMVSPDMNPMDVNITIGRHTTDNLQTKTQAFSTLVATGELATIDCLEMAGLTNRVNEVVERGEKAKAEAEAKSTIKSLANSAVNAQSQSETEEKDAEPEKDSEDTNKGNDSKKE
jgi:hypothetical protein